MRKKPKEPKEKDPRQQFSFWIDSLGLALRFRNYVSAAKPKATIMGHFEAAMELYLANAPTGTKIPSRTPT